jgi:parallel beta-helix repeat protein
MGIAMMPTNTKHNKCTDTLFRVLLGSIALISATAHAQPDAPSIILRPGMDLKAVVSAAPAGANFVFEPGVYRRQVVVPKDSQVFVAKTGAILNGAMLLDKWTRQPDSGFWIARNLPPPLAPHGVCEKGHSLCVYREDLFVNNVPLQRVVLESELDGTSWLKLGAAAYIAFDPHGKTIELSVAPFAFTGNAKNVVLQNIVVEKYASSAQQGAIDARDGSGWTLRNVTARWNHGVGLYMNAGIRIIGGASIDNGQMGLGGVSTGAVVDGIELARNNYAHFSRGWEAGGAKFALSKDLVVRNTCVHDNAGPGLWTDGNNRNVLYEGNKVFDNDGSGIKHEISYDAVIKNNVVARNGRRSDGWLWGSQILIQNSSGVEVYGNVVEVAPTYGNAIGMIYQNRRSERTGAWRTNNNYVHDNTVVFLGTSRMGGIVADFDKSEFWERNSNRFDANLYIVPDLNGKYWSTRRGPTRWQDLRRAGMEAKGRLKVMRRSPMNLSCTD